MEVVKFAEAVAWPFAAIVIAIVVLLVVRMILTKSGKLGMKVKDWFSFEADASKQILEAEPVAKFKEIVQLPEVATAGGDIQAANDGSGTSQPPLIADDVSAEETTPLSRFVSATTVGELETAFAEFRQEGTIEDDLDFWTTWFVERKQVLGLPGTSEELQSLASANPTWIYPTLNLLRSAIDAHDTDRVSQLIDLALARRTGDNASIILPTVLFAYFTLYSPARAIEFYQEQCRRGLTSSERAAMLSALAGNLDKGADKFAYRVTSEMALAADPGKKAEGFQLAYSYGDDARSWTLSYNAYSEIGYKSDQYAYSLNNRGVLLQSLDKSASIEYYERGLERGNAQSISNLARLLIDDGYIEVAERMLGSIEDPSGAAEHIASTRAAALKAKREMQKRLDELSTFATAEAQRYRAVIGRALRALDAGVNISNGLFGSIDGAFLVMLDAAGAAVRNRVGTILLEGVLPSSIVGYNGVIYSKGSGLLGSVLSISIFATGQDELTVVVWSSGKSEADRMRFIELKRQNVTTNAELTAEVTALLSNA